VTSRPAAAADGSFFQRVYAVVRAIPPGRVLTYGEVARAVGMPRGARAVGWALRALGRHTARPVPWHRVVGHGGRISPRDGAGMAEQRARLLAEGVRFRGAVVDLRRHGRQPQRPQSSASGGGRPRRSRARRIR